VSESVSNTSEANGCSTFLLGYQKYAQRTG
jgi:hypothetical protein